MTEQELIQANEKLNARLQKAVEVFNEQKTTIARLTEERDAARAELQKAQETISVLEEKVEQASAKDDTFFEQVKEIDELNKQLEAERNEKKAAQEAHDVAQKSLKETKAKVQTIQTEFTQKLQTMEEAFAEMCNEVI